LSFISLPEQILFYDVFKLTLE